MLKRLIFTLALSLSIPLLAAQEVEWSVDASVVFNNSECGDDEYPAETFVFTRLAPEVGLSMFNREHTLKGGVVWYQPMADDMSGYKVLPTLYYRYNNPRGWHVTAGMMPRSLMVERSPRYMWSDSLNYCQPNLRGVMAQFIKPQGYAELAIDWRQVQTKHRREAFTVILNTDWRVVGPLSLGGHVQYSHLAKTAGHPNDQFVNDDLLMNPMLKLDFSRRTALDSLRVAAGAIVTMERCRRDMHWLNQAGFLLTATARWRWLQLDQSFYTGQKLFPLYPTHGSLLNLGDKLYNHNVYSRTDLTAHVVNNRFVDLSFSLTYHATDQMKGFWQQMVCRFYIDNHLWKRRHDTDYLKSARLPSFY